MHKSPDRFERDLEREIELAGRLGAPRDPELAADWALKRELAGLGAAELPERVRVNARRNAAVSQPGPWLLAVAAVMVAAVVVTLVFQSPVPSPSRPEALVMPSARDLVELQMAFDTINRTGKRAVALAGREVQQSLAVPDLGLAELPYAAYIRPYFERPDRS